MRKRNQSRLKPPDRKRKVLTTVVLIFSLFLGKPRLSSSRSSRPGNQVTHERVIGDREFNSLEVNDRQVILAKNSGEAEAFSVPNFQKPVQNHNGLFGTRKDSLKESFTNDNPDDDPSNTPFSDSEINPDCKENRPESKNFEHQIYEKISGSDSETDDESKCSIEEVKLGVANDGTFIHVRASKVRDKGLHIPDFLAAEILDGKFDVTEAETLKYPDRLNYLRDKKNLPDDIVYQARDEILNFMTAKDTKLVPGFLGYRKIEGTIFINLRLNKVGFRDSDGYKFRTAMTMSNEKILNLAQTGFHLFPNAGKP